MNNDLSLNELNLSSLGDTYIVISAGRNVSIQEITSDTYFPNLYFILEKDATLTLNADGVETSIQTHVYSKNRDNNSKLTLGSHTKYFGSIDVDTLEIGDSVSYTNQKPTDLSGALQEGYEGFCVVEYKRSE